MTFPEGVAVQESMCGTAKPVNLKYAVRLTLSSHFEPTDASSASADMALAEERGIAPTPKDEPNEVGEGVGEGEGVGQL